MTNDENLEGILSSEEIERIISMERCNDEIHYLSTSENEDIDCVSGYHIENIFGKSKSFYNSKSTESHLKEKFDYSNSDSYM